MKCISVPNFRSVRPLKRCMNFGFLHKKRSKFNCLVGAVCKLGERMK